MSKRAIIFGEYNTAVDWLLTLTSLKLTDPVYRSNFVTVPGRDGELDLSTVLTDGEPSYGNRTLTATFESSEGTRQERQEIFDELRGLLDGRRMTIRLPDYDYHYLEGRVHVAIDYNDNAHGALTITAVCGPWMHAIDETILIYSVTATVAQAIIHNYGRRTLIPTVVVAGGTVALSYGSQTWSLSAGTYTLPGLALQPGSATIGYSGSGSLTVRYREAVL